MTTLSSQTLTSLASHVQLPLYDRRLVRAGIAHIGVGGFHRAHQAMYLDRLLNQGSAMDWGICGVGLLPPDARMRDVMSAQDCLYTLVLKHPNGQQEARVIGSIVEYMYAPDAPAGVVERLADPGIRIVSLTITEGGYNIDPLTGEFDLNTPAVAADLHCERPATAFGLVTRALARRRAQGTPAFTVMSCDNVAGNGHVARKAFTAFARAADLELGDWVDGHVRFPNSMVDRITPQTTDEDRASVGAVLGVDDGWPVVAEPFCQWLFEDSFSHGRPPYERVGAQVVDDVEPYEMMKLRLLNAGHQVLGCLGHLAGYRMLDEVARDPAFVAHLRAYFRLEAAPTLRPVPGIDLGLYQHQLVERFANPGTRDTVARQCVDISTRIPTFLLPVVRDQLAAGRAVGHAAATVAAWARYCEGTDEQGGRIDIVDSRRDALMAAACRYPQDPLAFLRQREIFADLADDQRFVQPYRSVLASLHQRGARRTVADMDNLVQ
jgi:mannitol 2-dehydrogenase